MFLLLPLLCESDYFEVGLIPPACKSQTFDVLWLGFTFPTGCGFIYSCAFVVSSSYWA